MSDTVALWLGERLLIGSVQGAVVIALVCLVCRLVPRMPAAAQSALWWLAALKLVLVFTPVPALPVALLPATVGTEVIFDGTAKAAPHDRLPVAAGTAEAEPGASFPQPIATSSWLRLLVLLWIAMVLAQVGRLLSAHRVLRGIVNRSVIWPGEEIRELAERVGLARVPQVRLSDEIDTPQVCGLRNPVVLVPAETMATFTVEERAMVLCHELMHLRRRDLALGWVPACAERLFFFHPLARLAARRYMDARETACDAAAVQALSVPVADYARLLVRLGIGTTRPALAVGGSPLSTSSLKRRLTMLQHHSLGHPLRWRFAIALIATAVIPIQLVARTPETPPQEPKREPRTVQRAKAEQQNAQERINAARRRVQQAPAGQQPRRPVERAPQLQQAPAEQDAGVLHQQAENHKRMLELMAIVREKHAHKPHQVEAQLKARIALLEQLRRYTPTTEHETLAQQYRQLAEHYEQLAAEQRKLAEEVERAQREAAPVK